MDKMNSNKLFIIFTALFGLLLTTGLANAQNMVFHLNNTGCTNGCGSDFRMADQQANYADAFITLRIKGVLENTGSNLNDHSLIFYAFNNSASIGYVNLPNCYPPDCYRIGNYTSFNYSSWTTLILPIPPEFYNSSFALAWTYGKSYLSSNPNDDFYIDNVSMNGLTNGYWFPVENTVGNFDSLTPCHYNSGGGLCYHATGTDNWAGHGGGQIGYADTYIELAPNETATISASLSVNPTNGNITNYFFDTVTVTGGTPPFNYSKIVNGNRVNTGIFSSNPTFTDYTLGYPIGTHRIEYIVTDSNGLTTTTNPFYITVSQIGNIPTPTLTINPLNGTAETLFTYQTGQIIGGLQPYTVVLVANGGLNSFKLKGETINGFELGRCTVNEGFTCSGGFSGAILPINGTILISAYIADNATITAFSQSNGVNIYLTKPLNGNPLYATLSGNNVSQNTDLLSLTTSISGSYPPYTINWFKQNGILICSEIVSTNQKTLNLYPVVSNSSYQVAIIGSDGQQITTNSLFYNIVLNPTPQGYNQQFKNVVLNCLGTLGETSTNQTFTTTTTIYGSGSGAYGTNSIFGQSFLPLSLLATKGTALYSGLYLIEVLFTPIVLSTIIMLGIAVVLANYAGGDNKGNIFLGTIAILTIMFSIIGIYPVWILVIFVIGVGVLVAKNLGVFAR